MRAPLLGLLIGLSFATGLWADAPVQTLTSPPSTQSANQPMPEAMLAFIDNLAKQDGFDKNTLLALFKTVSKNDAIIEKISKPSEKLPWYKYKKIFEGDARLKEGVAFWQANEATLLRAEQTYQVPAEIIVAILGVETQYGKFTGTFPVLESLTTLAFYYPPRAEFFKGELRQYLLLMREEGVVPMEMKGSYAGAMGKPQFISSSYRNFAVDFDQDGRRDLAGSTSDAIGSVANYFHAHDWKMGQPVVTRAKLNRHGARKISMQNPADLQSAKLNYSLEALVSHGVRPKMKVVPEEQQVSLMAFDAEDDLEYWIGFHNFSVITKYNLSPHYAMAVYQLSEQLKAQRRAKS